MLFELVPKSEENFDYDVFISYSHDDRAWVRENVFQALKDVRLGDGEKLSVFFDEMAIHSGDDWRRKLTLAIINSRFVIPVYSVNYFRRGDKGYCIFELDCAYNKWIQDGKSSRFLLPIAHGNVDVPLEYSQVQYVRVDDDPVALPQLIAEIVDAVSQERRSAARDTMTG